MDLNTILSLGAALFNATRGGSAGSGGGSSFFTPAPTGGSSTGASTDWGSILSAIGQTAGQIKATPRAGASRKDIEKANRINLLTGLLGGGAQIAGGLMSQQRKGEAYSALGDILSGRGTTTGQAVTPSEGAIGGTTPTVTTGTTQSPFTRTMALAEQYPELADKFLDVGIKQQQAAQNAQLKLADMYRKAQPTIQDELAVSNILKNQGILPEDIPGETQRRLQEIQKTRLGALGTLPDTSSALRGLGGPESMATQPTVTATPDRLGEVIYGQPQTPNIALDEAIRRAERGQLVDTVIPPEKASQFEDKIRQGVLIEEQPTNIQSQQPLSPGMIGETPQERARKAAEEERYLRQEQAKTTLEKTKAQLDSVRQTAKLELQKDTRAEKAEARQAVDQVEKNAWKAREEIRQEANFGKLYSTPRQYKIAKDLLLDPNATGDNHRLALTALIRSIDDSQVTVGEQTNVDKYLLSKMEQWTRELDSLTGKPFPPYRGEALQSLLRDVRAIGQQIGTGMELYNKKYNRMAPGVERLSPFSPEEVNTVQNDIAELDSLLGGPRIAGITPTPTPRPTMSPLAGLTSSSTAPPSTPRRYQPGMFSR